MFPQEKSLASAPHNLLHNLWIRHCSFACSTCLCSTSGPLVLPVSLRGLHSAHQATACLLAPPRTFLETFCFTSAVTLLNQSLHHAGQGPHSSHASETIFHSTGAHICTDTLSHCNQQDSGACYCLFAQPNRVSAALLMPGPRAPVLQCW